MQIFQKMEKIETQSLSGPKDFGCCSLLATKIEYLSTFL
jgi:hypothetical protein